MLSNPAELRPHTFSPNDTPIYMTITRTPTSRYRRLLPTFVARVGVLRSVVGDFDQLAVGEYATGERTP